MGNRFHLPRALLLYLALIVTPALLLLYLGLNSVHRQRQAVRTLAASNRALAAEKLASEIDARVRSLAEAALDEEGQTGQPHTVAQHYFIVQDNRIAYPLAQSPPPRYLELPAIFMEAESIEHRSGRPDQALAINAKAFEQAASDELKALALSRMARCQAKLNQTAAATESWRTLLHRFAHVYDPAHRPYGLTALLELGETDRLHQELVSYRWSLSAEQFDYYFSKLNRTPPPGNRFQFARELDEHFRHTGPLRQNELHAFSLPSFEIRYRLAGHRIRGLAINRQWVRDHLEPQVRADLGLPSAQLPDSARDPWLFAAATLFVLLILVLGVVLVVRDVVREARMNQLRADFVSGVSHELKTPLTLIRLYAETLLRKEHPAEQRRGFYEIITRETERLSHLIQKVLSFSRIERGEKEYSLQQGDLGEVIGQTVQVYSQYLERAGFQVETDIANSLPAVRFDPDAVSQAVVNLLDNAAKYSPADKFVGIRLNQVNGGVRFEVEDHGTGIPSDQKEKIFERFYRVPNGSPKGGYGLGLFLVRHIMEAHNGSVEVESEYGRGSCFKLIFPVAS